MIDHITIYVNDLTISKSFYEQAFTPFGYKIVFGEEGKFWAFDVGNGTFFEIAQHRDGDPSARCHIAFRAKDQAQVRQFNVSILNIFID